MGNKIIVAGLGHGGIVAGALLSKVGYDVTVYEQKEQGTLGYDWTDIFAPEVLSLCGMKMPDEDEFEYKENMTFFGPSEKVGRSQHVPKEKLEIKMERRDIYNHFINYALECGVKINYGVKVLGPEVLGNRVVGIKTDKGSFLCDLVIDSCGMNSPVRNNLPDSFGIEKSPARHERITIYRAFFNKACDDAVKAKFKVCLFKDNKLGVSWVASEEEHTDLLIGRFEDYDIDEVNRFADILRKTNPRLGTEIVRGGQFVDIPVRQPLSLMVADGYAAIGDSAFMTVPIIGSGIANSLRAARILADTVIADKNNEFSSGSLWKYQYKFFRTLGTGLASLAAAKLLALELTPEEADYALESGMVNEDNVTIGSDFTSIFKVQTGVSDIIDKAFKVCKMPSLLKKLPKTGIRIASVLSICSSIPVSYNKKLVDAWKKSYQLAFRYSK